MAEKTRNQIDDKYKWDLTDLYQNWGEWDKDYETIFPYIEELATYKNHILDSSDTFYKYLKLNIETSVKLDKLDFYQSLKVDEDLQNKESKIHSSKMENLLTEFSNQISFAEPEILKADYDLIDKYIKENPKLQEFEFMLKKLFRLKEHILNTKEEQLLSNIDDIANNFKKGSSFLRTSEMDFGYITDEDSNEVKLNSSNFYKYGRSSNREVRKQAHYNRNKAYANHINVLASNYIGHIKTDELEAKMRKYTSAIDMAFESKNINKNVYETLKKSARKNIDTFRKYINLYRDSLGIRDLKAYDLSAPLVEEADSKYTVEDAKEIILDAFKIYGEEYTSILNEIFDKKLIDFVPNKDKPSGWYACHVPCENPRISANFDGKISDVSSLCHELGHLVNQYKSIKKQKPQYVYNSPFCAEVVSIANEIVFANKYLEKCNDKQVKLQILGNLIDVLANNYFGALVQAIFEEKAHQAILDNIPLTADRLNEYWEETFTEFYGTEIDEIFIENWARIPHFFNSFYTYSYSTGVAAACALASNLLKENPEYQKKFMTYLGISGSMEPLNSLMTIDIDMENDNVFNVTNETISQLIDKFYKIKAE